VFFVVKKAPQGTQGSTQGAQGVLNIFVTLTVYPFKFQGSFVN